jgi:SCP-2 sterol transfer family
VVVQEAAAQWCVYDRDGSSVHRCAGVHPADRCRHRYQLWRSPGAGAGAGQLVDRQLRSEVPWLTGITASYLFDLSGEDGGMFHLIVRDGVGSAGPGSIDDPDVTLAMTAQTFMNMKGGTIDDGAIAFLNGEVTMDGDQALCSGSGTAVVRRRRRNELRRELNQGHDLRLGYLEGIPA